MRRNIQLIYYVLIAVLSILLYNRMFDMANFCRIALSVVLFIYLWFFKDGITQNVFLCLSAAIFFSIAPFVFLNPYKLDLNNIYIVFFLIVHFCYIQVFKYEKANIFANRVSFKSFFVLIIVAFVALEIINYRLTNLVFYIYILFAFQKITMIWLAFNRNLSPNIYKINVWAMICLLLSDAFHVINIFIISISWDAPLTISVNFFYVLGQFLLFESIIYHHASQPADNIRQKP